MNCKQGDLAVIVRSCAGHEGKIVTCVRLAGDVTWVRPNGSQFQSATLEIDVPLTGWAGDTNCFIEDSKLRPLRDNDGEDEMIRIAGLPQEGTV